MCLLAQVSWRLQSRIGTRIEGIFWNFDYSSILDSSRPVLSCCGLTEPRDSWLLSWLAFKCSNTSKCGYSSTKCYYLAFSNFSFGWHSTCFANLTFKVTRKRRAIIKTVKIGEYKEISDNSQFVFFCSASGLLLCSPKVRQTTVKLIIFCDPIPAIFIKQKYDSFSIMIPKLQRRIE